MRLKTDEELAHNLSSGELEAFDELYRRYSGRLAAYTGRLLHDRGAGEDVAQSSLMSAYETISRGTRPRHVRAWLFRIARNNALEQLAGRKPIGDPASEPVVEGGHATSSARNELLSAIQALPERQRRVFLLREIQGLRIDEIASKLNVTDVQVEQSLFSARNRLAEHLVFGERVGCKTVGSLDAVALGSVGRRAVKAHMRSCPSCRTARPAFAKVSAGLVPVQLLALLRGFLGPIFGGGSSVATTGAALTAAGAVALAAPVAVPKLAEKLSNRPAAALIAAPAADAGAPPSPHRRWSAAPTPLEQRASADRPAVRLQRQAFRPSGANAYAPAAPTVAPTAVVPIPTAPAPTEPPPAEAPRVADPEPPASDPPVAEPTPSEPPSPPPAAEPVADEPQPHGQPPADKAPAETPDHGTPTVRPPADEHPADEHPANPAPTEPSRDHSPQEANDGHPAPTPEPDPAELEETPEEDTHP